MGDAIERGGGEGGGGGGGGAALAPVWIGAERFVAFEGSPAFSATLLPPHWSVPRAFVDHDNPDAIVATLHAPAGSYKVSGLWAPNGGGATTDTVNLSCEFGRLSAGDNGQTAGPGPYGYDVLTHPADTGGHTIVKTQIIAAAALNGDAYQAKLYRDDNANFSGYSGAIWLFGLLLEPV